MWYLILATCTGSFEAENLKCTEAEIMSEHITQQFCTDAMKDYEKSGISVLCMEKSAVSITVPRGTKT